MPTINVSFKLTVDQFIAARKLHLKTKNIRTKFDLILSVLLLLVGIGILLYKNHWLGYMLAIVGVIYLLLQLFLPVVLKKQFYSDQKFRNTQDLTFSENGITYKSSGVSSNIDWNFYSHFIEGPDLLLLTYSKYQYTIIPKNSFTSTDELRTFIAIVQSKLK